MIVLADTDPELRRAWSVFPDPEMLHEASGEVLQYLQTVYEGRWSHVFRHRCAPLTHQRVYWHIPAPPGWVPVGESARARL